MVTKNQVFVVSKFITREDALVRDYADGIGHSGMMTINKRADLGCGVAAQERQCPNEQLASNDNIVQASTHKDVIGRNASDVANKDKIFVTIFEHLGCNNEWWSCHSLKEIKLLDITNGNTNGLLGIVGKHGSIGQQKS